MRMQRSGIRIVQGPSAQAQGKTDESWLSQGFAAAIVCEGLPYEDAAERNPNSGKDAQMRG